MHVFDKHGVWRFVEVFRISWYVISHLHRCFLLACQGFLNAFLISKANHAILFRRVVDLKRNLAANYFPKLFEVFLEVSTHKVDR